MHTLQIFYTPHSYNFTISYIIEFFVGILEKLPFSVDRLFFWPKSQDNSKIHSDIKIHSSTFGFVGRVSNSQYIATNVAIVPINLQLHAISTIYVSQKCSKRVTSKRFNTLHIISTFQNMLFMPANSNLHFCCYNYDVLYGQQWIKYLWSF